MRFGRSGWCPKASIALFARENPDLTHAEIAEEFGCHKNTVAKAVRDFGMSDPGAARIVERKLNEGSLR